MQLLHLLSIFGSKSKIADIETAEIEACQIDGENFVNFCGLLGKRSSVVIK